MTKLIHFRFKALFQLTCMMTLWEGCGYIHDCRNSSDTKQLFSRQPFPMPKSLYTRLPCIKYKSAIYTAAVSHDKRFSYTAAVHQVKKRYLHGRRFPFKTFNIHYCRTSSMKWIHVFTRQSLLQKHSYSMFSRDVLISRSLCKMQKAWRLLFFSTGCNVCGHFYQF